MIFFELASAAEQPASQEPAPPSIRDWPTLPHAFAHLGSGGMHAMPRCAPLSGSGL